MPTFWFVVDMDFVLGYLTASAVVIGLTFLFDRVVLKPLEGCIVSWEEDEEDLEPKKGEEAAAP